MSEGEVTKRTKYWMVKKRYPHDFNPGMFFSYKDVVRYVRKKRKEGKDITLYEHETICLKRTIRKGDE